MKILQKINISAINQHYKTETNTESKENAQTTTYRTSIHLIHISQYIQRDLRPYHKNVIDDSSGYFK